MSNSLEEALVTLELELNKATAIVHVKDECLKIAMATLAIYARSTGEYSAARSTLDRIEEMLPEGG